MNTFTEPSKVTYCHQIHAQKGNFGVCWGDPLKNERDLIYFLFEKLWKDFNLLLCGLNGAEAVW